MIKPKEYPYDDQFPDNVDPSDKNRRELSKQKEQERKDAEKEAKEAEDNA